MAKPAFLLSWARALRAATAAFQSGLASIDLSIATAPHGDHE